jgi:LmbE family N-acetylglucosaminyl deacetylase
MNKIGRHRITGRKALNKTKRALWVTFKQFKLERFYLLAALGVLLGTTLFWTILGAKLHSANADQLVNSYLFQDHTTFHNAYFPSAHTFLIKWPLFFLIRIFGITSATLVLFTAGLVLATVALFAAILYSMERRPIVLGTIYLALASVLLLVPPVPSAGTLLPTNMAMLTTRNLEYVLYIGALMLLIKNYRLKNWPFWLSIIGLGLLGASDKLFLYISLAGALSALVVYGLTSGWNLVSFSAKWVVASVLSAAASLTVVWGLTHHHITNISAQTGGPYGAVHSLHSALLGLVYAATGLFTNLGANPAFDTTILKAMPGRFVHNFFIFGVVGFVVNALVLFAGLYAGFKLIAKSLQHNRNKDVLLDNNSKLAIAMLWSLIAALAIFVLSDHYYAADSRYLAISLFSFFIAITALASYRPWQSHRLVTAGEIMALGILLALPGVLHNYHHDQKALQPIKARNAVVLQVLQSHKVDYLVGDYWRVIPAKFSAPGSNLKVAPLESCTKMRQTLDTTAWQPDLKNHSFAYLLSYDKSLADYPQCSLGQVVKSYGRPNSSIVLEGNFAHPVESLLFYDHGINKSSPSTPSPPQGTSTVVPETLAQLPYTYCPVPTIMNIVAHQDDDLLFMSPDLIHDISAGHCIRTIYMTAGDAGASKFYWLGRQQGSEMAYSKMLGSSEIWVERILQVGENEYVTVANPRGNQRISLIFMYLPDGNLKGQGFASTRNESLERLDSNRISSVQSVYSGSSYSSPQLTAVLTELMHAYQPTEIRTQSNFPGSIYPDHSDHRAVGRFVTKAYNDYVQQRFEGRPEVPLKYYLGYPGHERLPNVAGSDLDLKESTFLEYSNFDGGVCHSLGQCLHDPAYGAYLVRQYQNNY